MLDEVVVVENFYNDPLKVLELARKVPYWEKEKLPTGFVGSESRHGYYNQALIENIQNCLQKKIIVDPRFFSFGVFCKSFENDNLNNTIHKDSSDWTGVVYLSEDSPKESGTGFYEQCSPLQVTNSSTKNDFEFRLISQIEYKFNRLVLFPSGRIYHKTMNSFGTDDSNCRRTQLFFFNLKDAI